jgi:hypothetical protein
MTHGFSTRTRLAWLAIVIVMLLVLPLTACGGAGGASTIPINLTGASGLGSLHIELVYDPAIIEVTAVKAGTLAKGMSFDSNITAPGRAIIGLMGSKGITGTGAVANVSFKAKAKTGTGALTLEKVTAYDTTKEMVDIKTTVSAGQYDAKSKKVTAPSISFQ